jgi:Ca2+-binding RTX toxin-like protein
VLTPGSEVEKITTDDNFSTSAIDLTGNTFGNVIYGNAGDNVLNGGGGTASDALVGLGGNDTYVVNHAGDSVVEGVGAGSDRVLASVSYRLAAGVEVEELRTQNDAGTAAINLTGNELANAIFGNAGNNTLDPGGGSAADAMSGGAGDDWYFVNHAADVVNESAGAGNDRVFASVSWTLAAGSEVELLSTAFHAGTDAIDLTGNELANVIYGNAGANTLDGGAGSAADVLVGLAGDDVLIGGGGADSLTGGSGADRFVYTTRNDGSDLITDFNKAESDLLDLHDVLQSLAGYNGSNAFSGGFLRFTRSGADTLVRLDADGGANSLITLARLTDETLGQGDTAYYRV